MSAAARRRLHFTLDVIDARKPHRTIARRQCGQSLKCRTRAAEAADERAERPRTDPLAAQKPEPFEALGIRKLQPFQL